MRKYKVIYADPPWRYDFAETNNRKIENQYPTMSLEEIKNLSVRDIADTNCVLYLWATAPKLLEAIDVIKSWGFKYKTHAIWDKEIIGMGYWFRGQHELLIVATKGKISPPNSNIRKSSILKYRRTKHSRKPDEIRELISLWFPEVNKIELFARKRIKGWDCWGDEVKSDTALVSNSSPDKSGSFNRNLKDLSADKSQISANAETSLNSDILSEIGGFTRKR